MKKIIKPGTDTYRATCVECGTIFTYEREDVHLNYMRGGVPYVTCPSCDHDHRHFGAGAWAKDRSA